MGIIERLIARRFSRSPKAGTDRRETPENPQKLDDLLYESKEWQEAAETERVLESEEVVWLKSGEAPPPVGAVITGILYADNVPRGYTYEIPTLEGLMACLRHEEKPDTCHLIFDKPLP